MEDNNKLLSAAQDLTVLCERRGVAVFSRFYDAGERAILEDSRLFGSDCVFYGGYEGAERCILGIFPEWCEPDFSEYPVKAVRISFSYKKKLSHRDYLGSIMGLGVERNRIGDILVYDDGAVMIVHESIHSYILDSLKKIGSLGVKVKDCELQDIEPPEKNVAVVNTVAASLRIDAVIAASLNLSRSVAGSLIEKGLVSVNHRLVENGSRKADESDLFSVRGYGRFFLSKIGGKTGKDRIHITIEKFL